MTKGRHRRRLFESSNTEPRKPVPREGVEQAKQARRRTDEALARAKAREAEVVEVARSLQELRSQNRFSELIIETFRAAT